MGPLDPKSGKSRMVMPPWPLDDPEEPHSIVLEPGDPGYDEAGEDDDGKMEL